MTGSMISIPCASREIVDINIGVRISESFLIKQFFVLFIYFIVVLLFALFIFVLGYQTFED